MSDDPEFKKFKKVSVRQLQKRAKIESDRIFENVVANDDWLDESGADQNCVVDGDECEDVGVADELGVAASLGFLGERLESPQTSVNCIASSDSFVVSAPTRLSVLYSSMESSSSEDDEPQVDLRSRLQEWCINSKINLSQLGALLQELRPFHPELPKDPRTVMKTPRFICVKELSNGTYVHLGLENGILSRLKFGTVGNVSKLGVDINMDGLQLSKSSNLEAWPILARCLDLNDNKPFSVGFFCGSSKPEPLEVYLHDYINEVQKLSVDGLLYEGQKYEFFIKCYILDRPARAHIKCIVGHTSFSGCERCDQEGEHDGQRMTYEPKKSGPRTNESFRDQEDDSHHKGVSPLSVLPTMFVTMFVLDPMHLLLHGVVKRFLRYLCGAYPSNARLTAAQISLISNNLVSLDRYIPRKFARKPRSLSFVGRWKATEVRLFLLYAGVVAMKGVLEPGLYSVFLLLHVASRIISYPELVKESAYVEYAEQLFSTFVEHSASSTVFGRSFIVYNVHSLLHLCEDVRNFGVMSNFSCFPFENHLGLVKRMVRSGVRVPQQIAKRLAEVDEVSVVPSTEGNTLSPYGFIASTGEYKSLSCADYMITPFSKKDSFFRIGDSIGQLKKIAKTSSGEVSVTADICEQLEDFYEYPTESMKVGVYMFSEWTLRDISLDYSRITGKFMVLPWEEKMVAIHLLHSS